MGRIRGSNRREGGIGVRLLFLGFTLLVIGASILWLLGRFQQDQKRNHRKALEAAEYALQTAMQQLIQDPLWNGFSETPYESGRYEARVARTRVGDSLVVTVEAIGRSGPISATKSYTVNIPAPADSQSK